MPSVKTWSRRILMSFVLLTIGYSWGRQSVSPTVPDVGMEKSGQRAVVEAAGPRLTVYAVHSTYRCPSCTQIELYARELIDSEFGTLRDQGVVRMQAIDYLKDPAFGERHDIASSTLVLVRENSGVEVHAERLDDVWLHIHDREAYMAFLRTALYTQLDEMGTALP